ncbi:MAG: serine/threonine protein kinase [Anaerolinea sp.]|nr:serine/threonine protein kinase [Anaerolinea sp.]
MMFQIGDQFDHFQIRIHLAQGGMADIYRAYDFISGKEVVLKVPNPQMIGDPAQYERFQRELEVTNHLSHPAIQKGLGSGQFNRTPYLVTEYVDGRSLRDIIMADAPLPVERVLLLIEKIADGMAYCHENEVIHRDLKPENILVRSDGQPIIIDFGLALTRDGRRVTYANLTATAGTPDYMSPEQIEGQRGDERTDIYALGTMMFEMLAGRLPFVGDSYQVVVTQHLQAPTPRLDRIKPGIAPQVAAICARAMQRSPEDRYASMREFAKDLRQPDAVDTSILEKGTGAATAVPFWKNNTFQAVLIGVVVLLLIIILALAAQGMRS